MLDWILPLAGAISFAGIILTAVFVYWHPAVVIGPVFRHIGIGHPWSMTQDEIRRDISGRIIKWEMVGLWPDRPTKWERLKNWLSEDRVDYRPEVFRFTSATKVDLLRCADEGCVVVAINFPPQLAFEKNDLVITVNDRRFVGARIRKPIRLHLDEEPHPHEFTFMREEFPLEIALLPRA